MKKVLLKLLIIILIFPCVVYAGSASTSISGETNIYIGKEFTINIGLNESGTGGLASFGGQFSYDSSKFSLVRFEGIACGGNSNTSNGKIGGVCNPIIKGNKVIARVVLKANALGTGTVKFNADSASTTDEYGNPVSTSSSSRTITINNPPSGNNNLKSLTVSPGGINFNPGNTNYTVNVDSNVTSLSVSAQAEDPKAQVSGVGNKQLFYGSNKISVNVKAENGNVKNYIINVNRKDDRSSDSNLKSLNVSNGKLNPGFNSNTTSYSMEVPYNISKLNIDARTNDSKAKVSISGNDLVAEKTTKVEIKVTAENGSTKVYTISVKRGKDPNKVLNTNNYLSTLSVDQGILSPSFNKEQNNYIVYLPYEIDKINISCEAEDKEYGEVSIDGPKNLGIGENLFKITVKAENEDIRTYNIIVNRGRNLGGEVSNNTHLIGIKIENGKLLSKFNKDTFLYKYKADKELKIEATPEYDDSKVEIMKTGNIYFILVTAPSGDKSTYILMPREYNIPLIIAIIMFVLVMIGVTLYIIANKRNKKHADIK